MPLRKFDNTFPRELNELTVEDLSSPDPRRRRDAALHLRDEEALAHLFEALKLEKEAFVLSALFDTLRSIGGRKVAKLLAPFLSSEDINLRTSSIATLKHLRSDAAYEIYDVLKNGDADSRIMALDVMQDLKHDEIPNWISFVLNHDTHPNVIGAALDRICEIGDSSHLPSIKSAKERFPDDPFIEFAAKRAIISVSGNADYE